MLLLVVQDQTASTKVNRTGDPNTAYSFGLTCSEKMHHEPWRRCARSISRLRGGAVRAENVGRVCRGVELDPRYSAVIIRRYKAATRKTVILADTGETFAAPAARVPTGVGNLTQVEWWLLNRGRLTLKIVKRP